MKTTITLKEFSALPSSLVQITHPSPVAEAGSQPQPTNESVNGFHVLPDRNAENFRELLHLRYTTPLPVTFPYHHGGLNE